MTLPARPSSLLSGAPAVYIGRFQPLHDAHLRSMLDALDHFERLVILPGSANLARSIRNPWSAPERVRLIRACLREAGIAPRRVTFRPVPDEFDSGRWAARVRSAVPTPQAVLVGFEKDASSAYLRWFPEWQAHHAPVWPGLNATDLRAAYFTDGTITDVSPGARSFLQAWCGTPAFMRLQAEWNAVETARAQLPPGARLHEERWVHVQQGHVWLRTRHEPVGHGLWELPGRVLSPGEEASPGADAVFGHPARALVASTTAHVWRAAPAQSLAGRPVPLTVALRLPRRFHEDHHVILSRLLGAEAPAG
ncbi:bifunctional nicotinamide mononucleotide adenylyltransferase/ADP-ribose pyrophosphatase [Deinococcus malanensis]|uniref:Bifunctional nicotinamide mononucleotide adenylyltransferase/ADP-ribose pyrophosphatase n=1 Tax=Deinococcus malanensis TaxID=1706855 RepID=A0ABQ2EJ81_9DEIO|nr:adenylyltransferase/cytidyltransferase family protein [Deinococcus malanensis]GGK13185.1 bifunctional nicotinamide mononucleotide adenylyltransferase/ADP-ribose pyrophosphatase [Deinococcus malanensis]